MFLLGMALDNLLVADRYNHDIHEWEQYADSWEARADGLEVELNYYKALAETHKFNSDMFEYYLYENWDRYCELQEEYKELQKGARKLEQIIIESRRIH